MLTRRQSIALYVAAISSALTATLLGGAMLNPCRQPQPPTHPVPAAK